MDTARPTLPLARKVNVVIWALLVAVYTSLLLARLGGSPLVEFDEFYTAERSREMLITGFPLKVQENFSLNVLKPPLHYALSGAALGLMEDREAALRLWPALFGIGSVILAGLLTRQLAGGWTLAPLLASLSLIVSFLFWSQSRSALLDTGTAFFTILTTYILLFTQKQPRWWLAAGAVAALCALQKYPLALLPMAVFLLMHVAIARSLRPLKNPWPWAGFAIVAVGYAGWFFIQALNSSGTFVLRAFREQMLGRATTSEVGGYAASFDYYLGLLVEDYSLYALVLLGGLAAVFCVRELRRRSDLLACALVVLIFLVAVGLMSKHSERYLVAILPLLASVSACALLSWNRGVLSHGITYFAAVSLMVPGCLQWPGKYLAWSERASVQAPVVAMAPGFASSIEPGEQVLLTVGPDTWYELHVGSILFYGDFPEPVWFLDLRNAEELKSYFTDNVRGVGHVKDMPTLRSVFPHFEIVERKGHVIHYTSKAPSGQPE